MEKLCKPELCTGCGACAATCAAGCITMTADENGFLFPVIDTDKCIDCGLCEKTCPVLHPLTVPAEPPCAYAAYSKDEAMRLNSSSGGIFTELAKVILQQGGAVYGAAYNERFDVVHICVEDEDALARLRGAKYAQSQLSNTFSQIKCRLDGGQKVLFSGTPCQVAGLKAFLRKDYENLLAVDFVCHSVPSPTAWREYVQYRAQQDNGGTLPQAINLRSKEAGWSHYRYTNRMEYASGYTHTAQSHESLYIKLFVGGYINRTSCANCHFKGYSRVSDLTVGDFWGIWDIAPEMDDNKGTSVVLVQSARGAEALKQIADRLVLKQVSLEEASCQNGAMLVSSQPHPGRDEALAKIRSGKIADYAYLLKPPTPTPMQRLKSLLRRIRSRLRGA